MKTSRAELRKGTLSVLKWLTGVGVGLYACAFLSQSDVELPLVHELSRLAGLNATGPIVGTATPQGAAIAQPASPSAAPTSDPDGAPPDERRVDTTSGSGERPDADEYPVRSADQSSDALASAETRLENPAVEASPSSLSPEAQSVLAQSSGKAAEGTEEIVAPANRPPDGEQHDKRTTQDMQTDTGGSQHPSDDGMTAAEVAAATPAAHQVLVVVPPEIGDIPGAVENLALIAAANGASIVWWVSGTDD